MTDAFLTLSGFCEWCFLSTALQSQVFKLISFCLVIRIMLGDDQKCQTVYVCVMYNNLFSGLRIMLLSKVRSFHIASL